MHHADAAAARPGDHVRDDHAFTPPPLPPLLESLLEERWWGGSGGNTATCEASSGGAEQQQPVPADAQGQQRGSWAALLQLPAWLRLGGRQTAPPQAAAQRRSSRRQGKPAVPGRPASAETAARRRTSTTSEGGEAASRRTDAPVGQKPHTQAAAGHGPRLPRRPSLARLQQLAGGQPRSQGEGTHGSKPRPGSKAANYAERRLAWRQRIDAIKAKQATRAAAGGSAEVVMAVGAGSSRVFSKHVAIPIPVASRGPAGSTGSTPQGSPARREAVLDALLSTLPKLETPQIWQGFQTAEAPPDMAAAGEEQLQRFLLQAGWTPETVWGIAGHEALVEAARASRGAWEVDRVIVACVWPEEVLRVPRRCSDTALLRAAYRRVSMAVHPDKCHAVGASDAQSIVSDCYAMLLHASSSGGKAIAVVPAFLRQQHAMRATVSSNGQAVGPGQAGLGSRAAEHSLPTQVPSPQHQPQAEHDLPPVDSQAAPQPAQPEWQAFHDAHDADSIPLEAASLSTWIPVPLPPPHHAQQQVDGQQQQQQQQQQQADGQHQQQQQRQRQADGQHQQQYDEQRSSDVELDAPAYPRYDRADEADAQLQQQQQQQQQQQRQEQQQQQRQEQRQEQQQQQEQQQRQEQRREQEQEQQAAYAAHVAAAEVPEAKQRPTGEQPRTSGSSSPLGSSCGTVHGCLHSAPQAEEVAAMLRRASTGSLTGCGAGQPSPPQAAAVGGAMPEATASPISKRAKIRVKVTLRSDSRGAAR